MPIHTVSGQNMPTFFLTKRRRDPNLVPDQSERKISSCFLQLNVGEDHSSESLEENNEQLLYLLKEMSNMESLETGISLGPTMSKQIHANKIS
ncbi:hypothetical protein VTO42DRAFT_21 [Malbranchea cinnamomea]